MCTCRGILLTAWGLCDDCACASSRWLWLCITLVCTKLKTLLSAFHCLFKIKQRNGCPISWSDMIYFVPCKAGTDVIIHIWQRFFAWCSLQQTNIQPSCNFLELSTPVFLDLERDDLPARMIRRLSMRNRKSASSKHQTVLTPPDSPKAPRT